jgi:nicotinic acid phosphoribosyltransferase
MNLPQQSFTALTTDLYEVTMACGYWKAGVTDHDAAFHVRFRENPFHGQFTVASGLGTVIDFFGTFILPKQNSPISLRNAATMANRCLILLFWITCGICN